MKSYFIKSIYVLSIIFFLFACSVNPSEHSDVTPSKVIPIKITKTVEPNIQQINTATAPPADTSDPNLVVSNSPDNKYEIELTLSETPIKLTILDNVSKQKTHIPISYGYYNKIEEGFKWSIDNKLLMFDLYREPNPEKAIESSSCFIAIDIEQAKLLKVNCSSLGVHIWTPDESGIITLEHGGLNDIFDYYVPGTNCYKNTLYGECVTSYTSPSGNWELSLWEEANVTLKNLHGDIWKYSYPVLGDQPDFIFTVVQGWSKNENYVLLSPSFSDDTSRVFGLFQMNLRDGNVISLLENKTIDQQTYFLSVSPSATKVIYITSEGTAFIKNLNKNTDRSFNIRFGDNEIIGNFVWSPDEIMSVFARLKLNEENEVISSDYFRLNLANGELITLLKNEPEYLNILKMTNSEVTIGQSTYSLVDGTFLR